MKIFAIHAFTYLYAVMCCNLRRICAAFTQYVGCSKIELYALMRCNVMFLFTLLFNNKASNNKTKITLNK